MSAIYVESSAVLHWLLGTPDGPALQAIMQAAPEVVTSTLTAAEVGRTLWRLCAAGSLTTTARAATWARFSAAAAHWSHHEVTTAVLTRAAAPYALEPVRTLDAVHLATAELYSQAVRPLVVLSVDARVRDNARALGLAVEPP